MRIFDVKRCYANIPIGKQGENLATQVRFAVDTWVKEFGAGSFQLLHQRATDQEPHAVTITYTDGVVYWDVKNTEVAIAGYGKCELQLYRGEILAKSQTWITQTAESLSAAGDTPPEPWESWVEEVLMAGAAAQGAAEDARGSATLASGKAAEAEVFANNAEISAQAAQDAANSMSFVSFDIDPDGSLYVNRSEHLGTTAFYLNNDGELEVSI